MYRYINRCIQPRLQFHNCFACEWVNKKGFKSRSYRLGKKGMIKGFKDRQCEHCQDCKLLHFSKAPILQTHNEKKEFETLLYNCYVEGGCWWMNVEDVRWRGPLVMESPPEHNGGQNDQYLANNKHVLPSCRGLTSKNRNHLPGTRSTL